MTICGMSAFAVAIEAKADMAFCDAYVRFWPKADILAALQQFLFLGGSDILRMFATRTFEHTVIFGSRLRLDAKGPHRRSASGT